MPSKRRRRKNEGERSVPVFSATRIPRLGGRASWIGWPCALLSARLNHGSGAFFLTMQPEPAMSWPGRRAAAQDGFLDVQWLDVLAARGVFPSWHALCGNSPAIPKVGKRRSVYFAHRGLHRVCLGG